MEILIESNDWRVTLTTLSPMAGAGVPALRVADAAGVRDYRANDRLAGTGILAAELVRAWMLCPGRTPWERAQAQRFLGDAAA